MKSVYIILLAISVVIYAGFFIPTKFTNYKFILPFLSLFVVTTPIALAIWNSGEEKILPKTLVYISFTLGVIYSITSIVTLIPLLINFK